MPGRRSRLARLRQHQVPTWWRDAKLGIFVHWTPASVVGFAPVDTSVTEMLVAGRNDAFGESPYTEWYENSLRFPESSASRHHREVEGDVPYSDLVARWEAALVHWDPDAWAHEFAATGAGYVVLVSKHHDGYCLWPSEVPNPRRPGWQSSRDVVGELAAAVRARGMRFGVYYSGGLDWTFNDHPIGTFGDLLLALPGDDYAEYAEDHVRELIARYEPSLLWGDISWPARPERLYQLFLDYFEAVPDGVVNDRWMPRSRLVDLARSKPARSLLNAATRRNAARDGGLVPPKPPFCDVRTPEYTVFDDIQATPWECVRGMDHSFGYNRMSRPEHFITRRDLLWSLADIAAKNGNLLLNVGPRGIDAQIPDEQRARLGMLHDWMGEAGHVLRGTRPWVRPGTTSVEGADVRYVARGETVWVALRGDGHTRVTLPEVGATPTTAVESVAGTPLGWSSTIAGFAVDLAEPLDAETPAMVALHHVVART